MVIDWNGSQVMTLCITQPRSDKFFKQTNKEKLKSPVLKVLKSQNNSSEIMAFKVFDLGTFSAKIRKPTSTKTDFKTFFSKFFLFLI